MEIAVVGTPEFTLGFQLAGVTRVHHPENLEGTAKVLRELLEQSEIGIVVIDSAELTQMSDRLRQQLSDSITPTVLGIGTEEDNTLRESIKSTLGLSLIHI